MKKIQLIILVIVLISCSKERTNSYSFMEKEMKEYNSLIAFKTHYYFKKNDEKNRKQMNELHQKIFDVYTYTSFFINASKNNPPADILNRHDKFFKDNCSECYSEIGKLKDEPLSDTMYFHKIKFDYIRCIIKNSKYYDSMPELKKRIIELPNY